MPDLPEQPIKIDDLLIDLTTAMTNASRALRDAFRTPEWRGSPFIYHMPKMACDVRISLSYTNSGVSGILHRTKTEQAEQMESTIQFEIVAVPPMAPPPARQ